MKILSARFWFAGLLALVACLALMAASTPTTSIKQPDKLVILSTTDVKGKTSPCG
ncbi:MAG: hypothetical protein HOP12_01435 [Candidatus Eisenbacteria bacterium]|uniref:Uncharacterized protein n=1 Tax=Eiseniibacteriota bacterium TaxID=2212470 RepID=A0A849SN01_UNCEI|nr:hypothetical protein [Candidatus Eisenbacteria bacterium]